MDEVKKILIVEDEPKVAQFIKEGLEESSYEANIAYDGLIGKSMAINESYNLIILDINLPYINGFELCRQIREIKKDIPVLMLTAHGTTEEKLMGFESGADDYLLKPFEFSELLARIKALLKRTNNSTVSENILNIADLEINVDTKIVRRGSKIIELTAKEYLLLEYLAQNKGRVLSRVDIAEKIWDIRFDSGTNVIDVYINFLRKKIDQGNRVKLIHTKIGLGYVLKEIE